MTAVREGEDTSIFPRVVTERYVVQLERRARGRTRCFRVGEQQPIVGEADKFLVVHSLVFLK